MHDPGHVHITASGGCLKIRFRPGNLGLAFTIGVWCSRILVDSGMTTGRLVSLQLVIWVHIDNNMSHMLARKHARAIGNILDSIHMLIALHRLSAMGICLWNSRGLDLLYSGDPGHLMTDGRFWAHQWSNHCQILHSSKAIIMTGHVNFSKLLIWPSVCLSEAICVAFWWRTTISENVWSKCEVSVR